jgi:hypothetical protein
MAFTPTFRLAGTSRSESRCIEPLVRRKTGKVASCGYSALPLDSRYVAIRGSVSVPR